MHAKKDGKTPLHAAALRVLGDRRHTWCVMQAWQHRFPVVMYHSGAWGLFGGATVRCEIKSAKARNEK